MLLKAKLNVIYLLKINYLIDGFNNNLLNTLRIKKAVLYNQYIFKIINSLVMNCILNNQYRNLYFSSKYYSDILNFEF